MKTQYFACIALSLLMISLNSSYCLADTPKYQQEYEFLVELDENETGEITVEYIITTTIYPSAGGAKGWIYMWFVFYGPYKDAEVVKAWETASDKVLHTRVEPNPQGGSNITVDFGAWRYDGWQFSLQLRFPPSPPFATADHLNFAWQTWESQPINVTVQFPPEYVLTDSNYDYSIISENPRTIINHHSMLIAQKELVWRIQYEKKTLEDETLIETQTSTPSNTISPTTDESITETTKATSTEIKTSQSSPTQQGTQPTGFDMNTLGLIVIAIIVIVVAAFLITKRKKS